MAERSWVPVPTGSPYPVQHLPYGVVDTGDGRPRIGVPIGDAVLDLAAALGPAGSGDPALAELVAPPSLNRLLGAGPDGWAAVRARLTGLLTDPAARRRLEPALHPAAGVTCRLPFEVADYVDFYSSEQHATNLGRLLRPGQPALPVNWRHLPVGYHGRAGTVVVSGTPVRRPCGQVLPDGGAGPRYGPTGRLDVEAEVGFVVGVGSAPGAPGAPVPTGAWREHVFGVVLVNDWSARDVQAWEYQPLGPFLAKSFATSVSAWVTPLAALEPAFVDPPPQRPAPLPYLLPAGPGLDLDLSVELNGTVVSRPPAGTGLYWTGAQQLAHLTAGGATLRTGDLYASGTVSGAAPDQRGSLFELAWGGETPVPLDDGSTRVFLADGDTVTIRAAASGRDGVRLGLGEVTGTVLPARP